MLCFIPTKNKICYIFQSLFKASVSFISEQPSYILNLIPNKYPDKLINNYDDFPPAVLPLFLCLLDIVYTRFLLCCLYFDENVTVVNQADMKKC